MVLLDTGTPGTSRKIYSEDVNGGESNLQPMDYKTSALAIELYNSKAIARKEFEFIQLVYCIIIHLSFLNCDLLLIREVHWFSWTQELLAPVERFTMRMPMVRFELGTPGLQTQCSSH